MEGNEISKPYTDGKKKVEIRGNAKVGYGTHRIESWKWSLKECKWYVTFGNEKYRINIVI
jgi:hypothetical protein